jgi:hypothetical protein
MSTASASAPAAPVAAPKRLAFFERYLTVWVLVCMVVEWHSENCCRV